MWSKPGVRDLSPLSLCAFLAFSERGKPLGMNPKGINNVPHYGADAVSLGGYLGIPRHYPLGGLPIDSVSTKSGAVASWASRPARWGDSLQGIAYENGLAGVCEHTIMKGRNRYADLQA